MQSEIQELVYKMSRVNGITLILFSLLLSSEGLHLMTKFLVTSSDDFVWWLDLINLFDQATSDQDNSELRVLGTSNNFHRVNLVIIKIKGHD